MQSSESHNALTHLDERGRARMVDVSEKPITVRQARACGKIVLSVEAIQALRQATLEKGDALSAARFAAICAVKKTSDLIPLCHPLPIDGVSVDLDVGSDSVEIRCTVRTTARTGVEMEALTGVCVAALTLYDMTKSVCKESTIGPVYLEHKSGGKSGTWDRSSLPAGLIGESTAHLP